MAFTGDLEHLSIVDVVQLLHATHKSGTLTVTGRKGAAQLVFSDGFIASANHFDEKLRIGAILVGTGALAPEELDKALAEQQAAGDRRRPLIATLLESGRVKKKDAFRGLETLIELTIVDILTWKTGTFTLEVGAVAMADEYRYFPEKLREDMHFHTENILMEALRIYDEKKRDGRLPAKEQEAVALEDTLTLSGEDELSLSAGDLGLEEVERLERRIPGVFSPLDDRPKASPHREALRAAAPDLPAEEQARLAAFLEGSPARPPSFAGLPLTLIILGADALAAHCLTTVCRHEGLSVFTTTDPGDVAPLAEQHRGKGWVPVLVLDREEREGKGLPALSQPQPITIELQDAGARCDALGDGIRTVLLRPPREAGSETFVSDYLRFLGSFPALLMDNVRNQGAWVAAAARRCANRLADAHDASAVAKAVIASVAELCSRSLALVVRGDALVIASGSGIFVRGHAPAPAPQVRVPLSPSPLLMQAIETGRCLLAPAADKPVLESLYPAIGAPADPAFLLVPLAASGKTVSLVYGDFGSVPAAPPPLDLLETFAAQATAAFELLLLRRKLGKPLR